MSVRVKIGAVCLVVIAVWALLAAQWFISGQVGS